MKVYELSSICDNLNTFKQMCTQMGHHFSYNMTYEPTIHIRDPWQLGYLTFNPYGIYFKTTGKNVSFFVI